MIDWDKYEGAEKVYLCEELHKGTTDVISKETNQRLATIYCADTVRSMNPAPAHEVLMDAFKLHRASKKLHDGICRIIGQVEVDPDEYTKEGVLLMLKELVE